MMANSHTYRAVIAPVPEGEPRPLWSVMVPTFSCADLLAQTLASVLAQDQGPERMEIEVVDDHSTRDDPRAVVDAVGRGRVSFFRQPQNQGTVGNLNTCLARSRGRLVHLLHGDDAVREGFYSRMQRAFDKDPEIGAAFCRQIFVDGAGRWLSISTLEQLEAGRLTDQICRLASEQRIMTPSIVVRRDVYERLGGFDRRLICAEDWEMWVRIAATYPIAYDTEPLALYRLHDNSNTGRHIRTAEDIRYTRYAIDLFATYLPPDIAPGTTKKARRTYALSALRMADSLLARDPPAAAAQIKEAIKLSRSRSIILRAVRLLFRSPLTMLPALLWSPSETEPPDIDELPWTHAHHQIPARHVDNP
jgi:glycosyltransferase involved in cell wall biosynthesis